MGILDKNDVAHDLRSNLKHQAKPGVFEGVVKNGDLGLEGQGGAAEGTRIKPISTRTYCGVRKGGRIKL